MISAEFDETCRITKKKKQQQQQQQTKKKKKPKKKKDFFFQSRSVPEMLKSVVFMPQFFFYRP